MIQWRAPSYENGRRVAVSGTVEIGAVFPPVGADRNWRWRMWALGGPVCKEGKEPTELGAKVALDRAWAGLLNRARLQEAA